MSSHDNICPKCYCDIGFYEFELNTVLRHCPLCGVDLWRDINKQFNEYTVNILNEEKKRG